MLPRSGPKSIFRLLAEENKADAGRGQPFGQARQSAALPPLVLPLPWPSWPPESVLKSQLLRHPLLPVFRTKRPAALHGQFSSGGRDRSGLKVFTPAPRCGYCQGSTRCEAPVYGASRGGVILQGPSKTTALPSLRALG